ncbi:MAG: hypothetical protein K2N73_08045 [Lachnospiraceae bacterium]|nr:hypothetical protein [Lachnospiraceae bacterium]
MFQGKRPAFSMMAVYLLLFFTGCADTEESVYGSGIRTEEIIESIQMDAVSDTSGSESRAVVEGEQELEPALSESTTVRSTMWGRRKKSVCLVSGGTTDCFRGTQNASDFLTGIRAHADIPTFLPHC